MEALLDLDWHREAKQLRESWQGRVLAGSRGHTQVVVLSVLAHSFEGAVLTLCEVVFPGFEGLRSGLVTAGRIDKYGCVVADVAERDGTVSKNQVIYLTDLAYRDDMRRLADRLKLSDQDRLEFFTCVQRWLVADHRLDPTMDPADPDAKRLVYH